jgi:hypothetical protein
VSGIRFRLRVAWLLVKLWLWWRWRRRVAGARLPELEELDHRRELPPIDTGGGRYRPTFRSQFGDSSESHTSPHSEGSNCTMASSGMALDYHTSGRIKRKGGDERHRQSDNEGGTDLYDAAEAWARDGQELKIKSGQGWGKVVEYLEAGRGVILQGTGGLAGCGDYTGGHAVYVSPERDGSRWLKGDPECSGWEWTEASKLEGFAERLSSGVYFAVTAAQSSTPPPEPVPPPAPVCPPVPDIGAELERAEGIAASLALDEEVGAWLGWLGPPGPLAGGVWSASSWAGAELASVAWLLDGCDDPSAVWGRGELLDPVAAAIAARDTAPEWGAEGWRALRWR